MASFQSQYTDTCTGISLFFKLAAIEKIKCHKTLSRFCQIYLKTIYCLNLLLLLQP